MARPTYRDVVTVPPPFGAPDQPRAPRIGAIDVLRGIFMMLIMWSHAGHNLEPGHTRFISLARHFLSGTVGFTTVSGLLVGWFAVVKRDAWPRVARRYRTQAIRLALIAHPLMALALFLPNEDPFVYYALRTAFITDVLAVLFLAVVPLIPRVRARNRLFAGAALLAINALINLLEPSGRVAHLIHEILCGVDPSHAPNVLVTNYGLLPLGGMFLVGSWLGDNLARAQLAGTDDAYARRITRFATALAAAGCALVGAWWLARHAGAAELARLLYPDYESTLYPIYLAWTLVLLAFAMRLRGEHPAVRAAALLGKTSLFVYVLQYYLVETIPTLLGWNRVMTPPEWLALCVAATALALPAAALWNRRVKRA